MDLAASAGIAGIAAIMLARVPNRRDSRQGTAAAAVAVSRPHHRGLVDRGFLFGMGMFGVIVYVPLFMQGVLGVSATRSGSLLTPLMVAFVVASIATGNIMARTGRYRMLALVGCVARDHRHVSDGGDEWEHHALGSGTQHDHRRAGHRHAAADLHAGCAERRAAGAHGCGHGLHAVLPIDRRDAGCGGLRIDPADPISRPFQRSIPPGTPAIALVSFQESADACNPVAVGSGVRRGRQVRRSCFTSCWTTCAWRYWTGCIPFS